MTNIKLFKEPSATALMKFTCVFHMTGLGSIEFWKKMTSLLEFFLKDD